MQYSRDELSTFPLQKLASLYPQNAQDEELLKEIFEMRASVSSYFVLTSLVDIRNGWQEKIIQKYVDQHRETMQPENPAELSPEDEAKLDANVITKEAELELQAKLDEANSKRKGIITNEEPETENVEIPDVVGEQVVSETKETAPVVTETSSETVHVKAPPADVPAERERKRGKTTKQK
jgi:hypothetical protein